MNHQQEVLILEKYLKSTARQFTTNDAARVTGLPVLETEYAIKDLMKKYDCTLKVTNQGDMIYDFGQELERRYKKTFAERMAAVGQSLWKGFTLFYKFMISAILATYFVIFLILIVVVIVAALGSLSGGDKGSGKSYVSIKGLAELVLRSFISIFQWNTILESSIYRKNDAHGYSYKHYEEKPSIIRLARKKLGMSVSAEKKGFVASVHDFVFGPPRVKVDPLANRQEVASFLREKKGLISISEVQALAGWKREQAENFMTECLAYFDGKAAISANGILYGDFSELIRTKDNTGAAPVIYYWDEYEPEYEITGNQYGRNRAIILMNLFNLFVALFVLNNLGSIHFEVYDFEVNMSILGQPGLILLGWIPLIYSIIFFLIPAVRWRLLLPLKKKQHIANIRKRLMKVIFQAHTSQIPLKKLTQAANDLKTTEEYLSSEAVHEVMTDCIQDLGGEAHQDATGETYYEFEQLNLELNEIERLREEKRGGSRDIGNVIFEA